MTQAHSERQHAECAPSDAEVWAGFLDVPGCPASIKLRQTLPKKVAGPEAAEGTRAHELLDACLKYGIWQIDTSVLAGMYDPEMVRGVQLALNTVLQIKNAMPHVVIYNEIKATIAPTYWGNCDIVLWDPHTCTIFIFDFKYGKNPVRLRGNPQLLSYLLGVIMTLQLPAEHMEIGIIQPRRFDGGKVVDHVPVTLEELTRWHRQALTAVYDVQANPPIYRPEPNRCRKCHGQPTCPARVELLRPKAPLPAVVESPKAPRKKPGEDRQPAPAPFLVDGATRQKIEAKNLSSSDLHRIAEALNGSPALESYVKTVEELSNMLAINYGIDIPGFKVVHKNARATWAGSPKDVANGLWQIAKISPAESMPAQLLSISAAEELLIETLHRNKASDAEINDALTRFALLTTRPPSSGAVLVPESDPRPSIKEQASRNFEGVKYVDDHGKEYFMVGQASR